MQVTGETLERAMAVLEGQTAFPALPSASDAEPGPAESVEVSEAGTDSEGATSNGDSEARVMPEIRRTPPKRNHLRGL